MDLGGWTFSSRYRDLLPLDYLVRRPPHIPKRLDKILTQPYTGTLTTKTVTKDILSPVRSTV